MTSDAARARLGSAMSGTSALLSRVAALPPPLLVSLALAIFLSLSIWEMVDDSATFDEAVHLVAGYLHLTQGDFSINPEHPPLAKMWCALPLLLEKVELPAGSHGSDGDQHVGYAYRWLYRSGNDPERLLFWGRFPTLFWGGLLVVSVYAVSREQFGPRSGVVSLVLSTFCPTLLAHTHYVTTDLAMTALFFLSTVSFRALLRVPSIGNGVACGVLIGGALAAKYSAVLLAIVLAPLAGAHLLARVSEWRGTRGGRSEAGEYVTRLATSCLIVGLLAYGTVWACYRFRYSMAEVPASAVVRPTPPDDGGPAGFVAWLKHYHALPEGYLDGVGIMKANWSWRTSFALGNYSEHGFRWYFPFSWLVKSPVPVLVLSLWGLAASVRRKLPGNSPDDFLIFPMVGYWIFAVLTPMNVGIRHLLPAFPAMMVLAGGVLPSKEAASDPAAPGAGVAVLLGATVLGCLFDAPNFISSFNLPSSLLWRRDYMLCDSSLDWGQDLKRLKRYMDAHGIPEIHLSYYGSASPQQLGLIHHTLPAMNIYSRFETWPRSAGPRPGDYVAISARNYRGIWLSDRTTFLRAYDRLVPETVIGHSILVYRIPREGLPIDDRR